MSKNFRITPDEFVKIATDHVHGAMVNRLREALYKQADPIIEEVARELSLTIKGTVLERGNTQFEPEFYFVFKDREKEKI